jgi:hypothetical protein
MLVAVASNGRTKITKQESGLYSLLIVKNTGFGNGDFLLQ